MIAHCMFEQSGTFKNEFKKLGIQAYDYDILNDFGETDNIIDLYAEIEKSYGGGSSIFDKIKSNDLIFAFFPCIRFENQILLHFRGDELHLREKSIKEKLLNDMKLQEELTHNYMLITKLVLVCLEKNIPLIIENPYSTQHYLYTHWALKPKVVDMNRRLRGDHYVKPTQYFFVNCEPKNNFIFEPQVLKKIKKSNEERTVERSMISKEYANRFIREFILEGTPKEELDIHLI